MADDNNNIVDLWQSQTSDNYRMTPEEIHMHAALLDQKLRRRTYNGYLVCAFLIFAFSIWGVIESDPVLRLGSALTVLAVAYLGYQVRQNRFRKPAAADGAVPSVDHLRGELIRQRDFHRGSTFWSRMLFLGTAGLIFFYGFARAHPEVVDMIRFEVISFIFLILVAVPLNLWMARKYQRQIDELDRQKGQS